MAVIASSSNGCLAVAVEKGENGRGTFSWLKIVSLHLCVFVPFMQMGDERAVKAFLFFSLFSGVSSGRCILAALVLLLHATTSIPCFEDMCVTRTGNTVMESECEFDENQPEKPECQK